MTEKATSACTRYKERVERSVSLGVKRGSALFAVKVLSIRAYYLSVRVT